jgi:hypothetical protein
MEKTIRFLSLVVLCFSSLSTLAQTKSDKQQAGEIVGEFYKFHRWRGTDFSVREINLRKKWFTVKLYKLFLFELKREKEYLKKNPTNKPVFGEGLKFEPWEECLADGKFYRNWYRIGKSSVDKNKAVVAVAFYNPQKCENRNLISEHSVELTKSKDKWLISDFIFPSRGPGRFAAYPLTGRLTEMLERKEY